MKKATKSLKDDQSTIFKKNIVEKNDGNKNKNQITTINEYIESFPQERQIVMEQLRTLIKEEAPNTKEKISWGMPTFYQEANLIHFAQAKNHLGLFPGPEAVEVFASKFEGYKTSKGTIQLPNNKPLPEELIRALVRYNLKKLEEKSMKIN